MTEREGDREKGRERGREGTKTREIEVQTGLAEIILPEKEIVKR